MDRYTEDDDRIVAVDIGLVATPPHESLVAAVFGIHRIALGLRCHWKRPASQRTAGIRSQVWAALLRVS